MKNSNKINKHTLACSTKIFKKVTYSEGNSSLIKEDLSSIEEDYLNENIIISKLN